MKQKPKTVLFYSSVKTKKMFSLQEYYKIDILILKKLGYRVSISNSFIDFLFFWKYDVAFIYFFRYGLLPALISRIFFKKVIFSGGIDNLNKTTTPLILYRIQQIFFILCYFVANKVIFVSNADINNVLKFFPITRTKNFFLSRHVINFEKYEYTNNIQKSKILITIAWMQKVQNIMRKGVDKAVYVFSELVKLDPDFKMVIIGPTGPESEYLFNIINNLGLENKINITGAISEQDKIDWLKISSIYLQLSEYEGFGISAIEALASGNIVFHSNKGGLFEGIGTNGIIINNIFNFQEIANTIIYNFNSKVKEHKINNGIMHVKNNFQFNRRLIDFQNVFNSL